MAARDLGSVLLTIARSAIAEALDLPAPSAASHSTLCQPAATFVTLTHAGGGLRGCVGSLDPVRPLHVDVRENAIAAAFRDPRFPPLAGPELEAVAIEVSLLSARERIDCANEDELVACLRPGLDGLVLEHGRQRATFLPQVWDALPHPREFLLALKRKAGLPDNFWGRRVNVFRYGVTKWTEAELRELQP